MGIKIKYGVANSAKNCKLRKLNTQITAFGSLKLNIIRVNVILRNIKCGVPVYIAVLLNLHSH
jgi:hypothetical protein